MDDREGIGIATITLDAGKKTRAARTRGDCDHRRIP